MHCLRLLVPFCGSSPQMSVVGQFWRELPPPCHSAIREKCSVRHTRMVTFSRSHSQTETGEILITHSIRLPIVNYCFHKRSVRHCAFVPGGRASGCCVNPPPQHALLRAAACSVLTATRLSDRRAPDAPAAGADSRVRPWPGGDGNERREPGGDRGSLERPRPVSCPLTP